MFYYTMKLLKKKEEKKNGLNKTERSQVQNFWGSVVSGLPDKGTS